MLTERSIINFLVWIGGLILGPYLAISVIYYNFVPIGVVAAICALSVIFGVLRDKMCVLPLLGAAYLGRLNFLPERMGVSDMCALATIAYYLIAYAALQRKKMQTGPLYFFVPILIIIAITLSHENGFGLRAMGGGREGGRGAILLLVAALTYVAGVSINTPAPRFLAWLPLYCVGISVASNLPYTMTTYFPATAPLFVLFTDNLNAGAYMDSINNSDGIVRNQGQATVGAAVALFLLCYYPIGTWWRPQRWWIAIVALLCTALVVMGGFRSAFSSFALMDLIVIWCYYSWRTLLILPPVALAILLATSLQTSHTIHLPLSAQRTLSFLPGDWDPEVASSADSSNDFREQVEKMYLEEDAKKSPLLGNGLSYDSADFEAYNYLAKERDPEGYYGIKVFVTGKMFHSGWISLYDAVGIIGFVTFLVLYLSLIWVSGRMIFRKNADRASPLLPVTIWMFCSVLSSFIGYFATFGDFKTSFPGLCYYAILWTHLNRIDKYGYRGDVPIRSVPFDPSRTEKPVAA